MKNIFFIVLSNIRNIKSSLFKTSDSNLLPAADNSSYTNNNEYLNINNEKIGNDLPDNQMPNMTPSFIDYNAPSSFADAHNSSYTQSSNGGLIFDKNNFFVKTLTDLFTFFTLYRITIARILTTFIHKKLMIEFTDIKKFYHTTKLNSLDEVIRSGLDFFEKNEMIYYNKIVLNNTKRNSNNIYTDFSNEVFTSIKPLSNTQIYPIAEFNASFKNTFNYSKHHDSYNSVFITLLSFFYKFAAYYNEKLTHMCKGLFVCPPAFPASCTFSYCLTNTENFASPNIVVYWAFDWLLYLSISKNRDAIHLAFTDNFHPNSKSVKLMIILFRALHYNEIPNKIIQDNKYFVKWTTNFSVLILKDVTVHKYFQNFIKAMTNCSYKLTPTFEYIQDNISLLELTEQPNYYETNCTVVSFFSYTHTLINYSLQATISEEENNK